MTSAARRSMGSAFGATTSSAVISRSLRRVSSTGVLSTSELRSDVAFSVADSERHRVRAVRVRQETATLAAAAGRYPVHGLSLLHTGPPLDAPRRRRSWNRLVGGGPGRMVTMSKLRLVSALSLSLAVVGLRAQPDGLDLLLINGKVFTANPAAPWAEAVAIRGNRITAVGTTAAIRQTAGADTWLVDVGGRVVIPGINDAHTHVGARPPGIVLKLEGNDPTLTDVLTALREAAAAAPADQWIYGTVGEQVLSDPSATRFTLDGVAPKRLVKLSTWTGHGVIFSTAGLRAIKTGDRDPDPPFARCQRKQGGPSDGRLDKY